jgi:outer membrane receptor protein involved in Fe transport
VTSAVKVAAAQEPAPPAAAPPPAAAAPATAAAPAPPGEGEDNGKKEKEKENSELELFALQLKLESLTELRVTVASKAQESMLAVPGNVTVYSDQDVRKLGYYTLSDLANVTPGYSSYTIFGENVFETRGQKAGSFNNNKHLLLIDGIPVSHARAYSVPDQEQLPLLFAKQIEFLRGPASALYGIGAFFGVVNITPRTLDHEGASVETNAAYGPRYDSVRVMSNALIKTATSESQISLGYFERNNSLDYVGTINDPNNLYRDHRSAVFGLVSHKLTAGALEGLGVGAILMYKDGGMGEGFINGEYTNERNDLAWLTIIPYVKYVRAFSHGLKLSNYFKYNFSMEKGAYVPFSAQSLAAYNGTGTLFEQYESRTHDIEAQSELHWQAFRRTAFDIGLNVDTRHDSGDGTDFVSATMPPFSNFTISSTPVTVVSVYAQYRQEIPLLKGMFLTAGGRLDNGVSTGATYNQFSPRVALVQKLPANFGLKAQYGTALRGPGVKELGLNKETAARMVPGIDVPNLKPETFQSFEFSALYNNDYVYAAATGFYNITFDALNGVTAKGVNFFVNSSGNTTAAGLELEVRWRTRFNLEGFVNYSYALAKDPMGVTLTDVPSHKLNGALMYLLKIRVFKLQMAGVVRWVSSYQAGVLGNGRNYPGNTTLDLNFVAPVGSALDITLQGRNILNSSYKLPTNGLAETPLPGAEVLVGLAARF